MTWHQEVVTSVEQRRTCRLHPATTPARVYAWDATTFSILPNLWVLPVRFGTQRQTMVFQYVSASHKTSSKLSTVTHVDDSDSCT